MRLFDVLFDLGKSEKYATQQKHKNMSGHGAVALAVHQVLLHIVAAANVVYEAVQIGFVKGCVRAICVIGADNALPKRQVFAIVFILRKVEALVATSTRHGSEQARRVAGSKPGELHSRS